MKIPSTITEQHLLGVLHVGIDLTVFEEPVRIESVRVRIHRFVMEHRPFRYSTDCQKEPTGPGYVPYVINDRSTGRDELSLVYIILRRPTRGP